VTTAIRTKRAACNFRSGGTAESRPGSALQGQLVSHPQPADPGTGAADGPAGRPGKRSVEPASVDSRVAPARLIAQGNVNACQQVFGLGIHGGVKVLLECFGVAYLLAALREPASEEPLVSSPRVP